MFWYDLPRPATSEELIEGLKQVSAQLDYEHTVVKVALKISSGGLEYVTEKLQVQMTRIPKGGLIGRLIAKLADYRLRLMSQMISTNGTYSSIGFDAWVGPIKEGQEIRRDDAEAKIVEPFLEKVVAGLRLYLVYQKNSAT
jgi:hypothetical protein